MIESIEFGLKMALYGELAVFSIIAFLIFTFELLNRSFGGGGSAKLLTETSRIEAPPNVDLLSDEEKAAIFAAIMAYIDGVGEASQGLRLTLKKVVQVGRWGMAGRMEVMDLRLRG